VLFADSLKFGIPAHLAKKVAQRDEKYRSTKIFFASSPFASKPHKIDPSLVFLASCLRYPPTSYSF